jgi:hypothetical protein
MFKELFANPLPHELSFKEFMERLELINSQ